MNGEWCLSGCSFIGLHRPPARTGCALFVVQCSFLSCVSLLRCVCLQKTSALCASLPLWLSAIELNISIHFGKKRKRGKKTHNLVVRAVFALIIIFFPSWELVFLSPGFVTNTGMIDKWSHRTYVSPYIKRSHPSTLTRLSWSVLLRTGGWVLPL